MPRKGPVPKRDVIPDPKYGNVKLAKFVNNLMQRGKKSTAEKIIYSALDQVSSTLEVKTSRRLALAMRWIVSSAKKRSEKNMSTKLAGELIDAADGRGEAVKKRQDTHKMAEANKAFSHFRF